MDMLKRTKLIKVSPYTAGVVADLTTCGKLYDYGDCPTLSIKRVGEDCEVLEYQAHSVDWPKVEFRFDDCIHDLKPGRYIGIVRLGCETVACELHLKIGRRLCADFSEICYNETTKCMFQLDSLMNPNVTAEVPVTSKSGDYVIRYCLGPVNDCGTGKIRMIIEEEKCQKSA